MLILDEPTNHLDDEHIKWLVEFYRTLLVPTSRFS